MADISTFPQVRNVLVAGSNVQTFIAGATIKAAQIVAFHETGVSNTIHPAVRGVTAMIAGVSLYDAAVGALVAVACRGCEAKIVNADDTTAIDAGSPIGDDYNAIGGTASAIEGTVYTAGQTKQDIPGGGTGVINVAPGSTLGATGRGASFVVATTGASAQNRRQADYISNGESGIQDAIDALPSAGGIVECVGHFYTDNPIVPCERLTLRGRGPETTIIELNDGVNDSLIKDHSSFADNRIFLNIENMNLEGNKANNTAGSGIDLQPAGAGHYWDVVFRDVYIEHFKEHAIICNDSHDYVIDHCLPEYNDGKGIVLSSGDSATIKDCVIKANSHGIDLTGTYFPRVYSNIVQQCTNQALISDTRAMIFGNMFDCNCQAAGAIEQVYMKGYYAILSGNQLYYTGTLGDYNVTTDADGWGHMITNNYLVGAQVSEVNELGGERNTLVRDNQGLYTEKSGTATLLSASTSIVVTHNLSVTPAAGDIMVTPLETWGNMTNFWIDTYTATQFTIHADIAPGADTDFAWKAIVL